MEELIIGEIVVQLQEHNLLQDFAEGGQNGHWPVVLRVQGTELLVEGDNLCIFPISGELVLEY